MAINKSNISSTIGLVYMTNAQTHLNYNPHILIATYLRWIMENASELLWILFWESIWKTWLLLVTTSWCWSNESTMEEMKWVAPQVCDFPSFKDMELSVWRILKINKQNLDDVNEMSRGTEGMKMGCTSSPWFPSLTRGTWIWTVSSSPIFVFLNLTSGFERDFSV